MGENEEEKKWRSIKVNEETYVLMRRLSAMLNMRNYEVVFISLSLIYMLIRGDVDGAKAIVEKVKGRAERQKWLINNVMNTLDEILKR